MKKIFEYKKLKYRYIKNWKKQWNCGFYIKKSSLIINEGSSSINYSQQCFEGIKCFLNNKNHYHFRINLNSYRFQKSCKYSLLPIISIFNFIKSIKITSYLNYKYIPNKKKGFLYIRPLLIGIGKNIGVKTSKKFIFTIFCTPSFYNFKKNSIKSIFSKRIIENNGHYKIGCNYITNIYNNFLLKKYNFDDYVHLNNNFFEEIGTSNIILYFKNSLWSPLNKNILPGINKFSILSFFKKKKFFFNINISFNIVNNSKNIISCGTAISYKIINSILFKNKIIKYKKNFLFLFINFFFNKIYYCLYKLNKWVF
ncbi:aminotransferase class IV [Candidatus Carsonella ruddii]|uniref:Branched-chain amino acid aminotransferase n=1 Tax=Carsonella ruddii TaxID=114186 RepID=A0A1U9RT40_CARRU|nr:aminotransferase class IV [Candidatus Carsonella ruddii]AQU89605.1 Branched-chain amino acid aminotransferase [Candidatus Carsonella ruddii]